MKHLVIDVRHLKKTIDGLGRYIVNLLNHLETKDLKVSLITLNDFPTEQLLKPELYNFIISDINPGSLKQHYYFYKLLSSLKPDVYFNPFIDGPFLTPAKKNIFAIHDLNHYYFSPLAATERKLAILYAKFSINLMGLTNNHIIVFSKYVGHQVVKNTLVNQSKLNVIYHGVGEISQSNLNDLPSYIEPDKYILYVGNNRPHKNIKNMIDAFILSGLHKTGIKLILAGNQIKRFFDINSYLHQNNYSSVVTIEKPSNDTLDSLYKNCKAVVYPSYSEGFGFPLLESWSYNKPIMCSSASCLPEVGGDAALYFNPDSNEEMSNCFLRMATDSEFIKSLVNKGKIRLDTFNWKKSAELHLKVFLS